MNDDTNQIQVPDSFAALYAAPGGHRLTEPKAHVLERYELCEDLAQMLTDAASMKLHELGVTEQDVLDRMLQGLVLEGSPVQPTEARWVVRRLAELLHWEPPASLLG